MYTIKFLGGTLIQCNAISYGQLTFAYIVIHSWILWGDGNFEENTKYILVRTVYLIIFYQTTLLCVILSLLLIFISSDWINSSADLNRKHLTRSIIFWDTLYINRPLVRRASHIR